jgi:hypothetical protein
VIEMVSGNGPVPAPASVSGAQAQEPSGALFPMAHHVREVPHYALQVPAMDVREETRVDRSPRRVFKHAAGGLIRVLDGALAVQGKDRNVD